MNQKKRIVIVGGGAAGLFAADALSPFHEIQLIEKESNIGNKFRVAGKGGLNITSNLTGDDLISKYMPTGFLDEALRSFDSSTFRKWLAELGIPTFVGTSGKVFPETGITANDILSKIGQRLTDRGVTIHTGCAFMDFDQEHQITIQFPDGPVTLKADHIIFALGGASWPNTGSDGKWGLAFENAGIPVKPFQPSNCGLEIKWPEPVLKYHAGKPLKNVSVSLAGNIFKGEATITAYGLEGYAIYPLVPAFRGIASDEKVALSIDFKPENTPEQLLSKIKKHPGFPQKVAEIFHLSSAAMSVIKSYTSKDDYIHPETFVHLLKNIQIPVLGLRPIHEAISTIGGIPVETLNPEFGLHNYPWISVIGEMVDWDAPTGGFLLQGCFSMAQYVAQTINRK
jgi:uncharacterized flavoprotein (TIGR03862 family)